MCWYCHWGWPRPVADIYLRALADLDGNDGPLRFGPAHIVWEDCNFAASSIWACLRRFDDQVAYFEAVLTEAEKTIVRRSLEELLALPEDQRDVEPEMPDGADPAAYPPPAGVEMVRIE